MDKKILVVDDEPDILRLVTFRLKKYGCEVLSATNGKEGYELICKEKPDLVLLDLRLPELDGTEVARKVKEDPQLSSVPIVILTASADAADLEIIKELKVEGYLTKPFELADLFATVEKYI